MNGHILDQAVQDYIGQHLNADVHKLALSKSPFPLVSSKELANQIAAKHKSLRKLPTWYRQAKIIYPPLLSIEQCSSESTAAYKSGLATGERLIDLTGGFGVDSFYFAKKIKSVTHCELHPELSELAAHNAKVLQQDNIHFLCTDGIEHLKENQEQYDTIYIDPARRSQSGKVFMLKDCSPDVVTHLDLLLSRSKRVLIKTAPLLDITAGLKELKNVSEIHIVSVRNECKELIWVVERKAADQVKIVCTTLNAVTKSFSFFKGKDDVEADNLVANSLNAENQNTTELPGLVSENGLEQYLYEPDTALLKSGAFNLIASRYDLKKLHAQTQLYTASQVVEAFPGRRFKVNRVISSSDLKREKELKGNVIARNYQERAENIVRKYKIKPDNHQFLIFTQSKKEGYVVIDATIEAHY